jgi:hypothetical protein
MAYELENFFTGDPQNSYRKNEAIKLFRSITATATKAEIGLRRVAYDTQEMDRFTRWFGPVGPNNAHLNQIKTNLTKIIRAVMGKKIILRNSAVGGGAELNPATGKLRTGVPLEAVAYVRPGLNNLKIYLLKAFFKHHKRQWTGAGVIFHELSHMFANTKDHCYMSQQCTNLALNQPDQARNNADNYRLYFEAFM